MDKCLRNDCLYCKDAFRCNSLNKEQSFVEMYKIIFDILYDNGIKNKSDIKKDQIFLASEYDYVAEIFWIIKRNYSKIFDSNLEIVIGQLDFHKNISCLFPTKVLYKTGAFVIYEGKNEEIEYIPSNFIYRLFELKSALLNGICCLMPLRIYRDCYAHPFKDYMETIYDWEDGKRSIKIVNNNDLKIKKIANLLEEKNEKILINLPFFNSISIDEYVDLVMTHDDEYKQFLHCMKKYNVDSYKEWCDEIDYNISKLNIIYYSKLKELLKKGIQTSLGLAVSIGLMQYPGFDEIKYLCSGKTVYDGIKFVDDIFSIKNILNQNDYWILWKSIHN